MSIFAFIKALKQDIDEGSIDTVNSLIDRVFGKNAPEVIELTGKDGKDLNPKIEVEIIDKTTDVIKDTTNENSN